MSDKEPVAEAMLDTAEATALPWAEVVASLGGTGSYWLATVRPDGRPHVVPIGPALLDGTFYFTTGQGTRKEQNLAHNPHCVISYSRPNFDIVIEGDAAKVHDVAQLERIAAHYAANGWPAYVHDGVLDAPFSASTTGPAPYEVYAVTPSRAFAFGTDEDTGNQTTRYRF